MNNQTIRLCGQDVSIVVNDPGQWSESVAGRCDEKLCQILIHSAMSKSAIDVTLLHEIIHLILSFNGFQEESADEQLVSVMSSALLAFIRDNPDLIKEII